MQAVDNVLVIGLMTESVAKPVAVASQNPTPEKPDEEIKPPASVKNKFVRKVQPIVRKVKPLVRKVRPQTKPAKAGGHSAVKRRVQDSPPPPDDINAECPYCGNNILKSDEVCPNCKKRIIAKDID